MSCSDGRVIFEVVDRGARGEPLQERLRIARQADLLQLPVIVDRFDAGMPSSAAAPAAVRTRTVSGPYCAWMLSQRAVEHLASAEDHEDPIAHLLGGGHVVRAEDDGGAAAAASRAPRPSALRR